MAVLFCANKCQPSVFDKEDFRTDHTVIESKNQEDGSILWLAKCDSCGKEDWHMVKDSPGRKANLTRWPHYNWSLGKTVESKDHMMALAKQKGYRPAE